MKLGNSMVSTSYNNLHRIQIEIDSIISYSGKEDGTIFDRIYNELTRNMEFMRIIEEHLLYDKYLRLELNQPIPW